MRRTLIGFLVVAITGGCGTGTATPLVSLLPEKLAGVKLQRQSFSGPQWLSARPEFSSPYFQPQFRAAPRVFLTRLGARPSDLTIAWAVDPQEGIQVIAYRVPGANASALIDAYLDATTERGPIRSIDVAGRDVTMIKSALPQRGFLYAHDDVLYAANSFHVDGRELSELIAKLPGRTAPQPPLERTLPSSLRGVALERSSFAGDQWLRAAPEAAFQPEVSADVPAMLTELDAPGSALTVAWATAPDGPKVVAYQITGVDGDTLRRSFLHSIPARRTTPKEIAGKRLTAIVTGVPNRVGYLYVHDNSVFTAGSNHLAPEEIPDLLRALP